MKTLDRYIAGTFVRNIALSVLSLGMLFFVQNLLLAVHEHKYPMDQLLIYHALDLPNILLQMAPPSVLLATVLTLAGLSRTNELIACFAIGIGMKRLVALFLSVVFIFSCLLLVGQDRFLPMIFKKRTTYYWRTMENKPNFFLDLKQDKIWYRSHNLIYNLKRFDSKTREILGMSVYEFDDEFHLIQVVDAERADFTPSGWKLIKGTVTVFEKDNQFPLTKEFATKDLLIAETPKEFQEIDKEVHGLRLKELWRYIQHTKAAGADTKAYEVQFHSRFSLSFIPLVMCALGIPFSTRTRREGGAASDLGLCLGITFFYWLFYSLSLSLGTNGALPPWLAAWLPSTIFVAVAATLIARQKR